MTLSDQTFQKSVWLKFMVFFKPLLLIVTLFSSFSFIGYLSTVALVSVEMSADISQERTVSRKNRNRMQLFWEDQEESISEDRLITLGIKKHRKTYWILIDEFNRSTRFRFDPLKQKGEIKLYKIKLFTLRYLPYEFDLKHDLVLNDEINWLNQSDSQSLHMDLKFSGNDPQILMTPVLLETPFKFSIVFILVILLFLDKKHWLICIGLFFLLVLWYQLFYQATTISFQAQVTEPQRIQFYWRDGKENFSEYRRSQINLIPEINRYRLPIGSFDNIERIAIEAQNPETIQLSDIVLDGMGYEPISVNYWFIYPQKKCLNSKKSMEFEHCLEQITVDGVKDYLEQFVIGVGLLLVFTLTLSAFYYFSDRSPVQKHKFFVRGLRSCFFLILFLIINLNWQADNHIHPDENAHIESIKYYSLYNDPPTVGDPRSEDTYQWPWGISRLDDLGISYFIAGKFYKLLENGFGDENFKARAFNFFLLLLVFLACKNHRLLLFITPFLCNPQFWYLYSYANRGGFVLLLSIILAWQLVNPRSSMNRFLNAGHLFENALFAILPGFLLGILTLEQTNYLLFICFLLAVWAWQWLFFSQSRKRFFCHASFIVLLAISVFALRYALDVSINGYDKWQQKIAYAEKIAADDFKPSIAHTDQSYFGLRLQSKGVPAAELLTEDWKWPELSFKSFTGLYGHSAEFSPTWYYNCFGLGLGLLLLLICKQMFFQRELSYRLFSVLTFFAVTGGIIMSFLFSWIYDFQPQGRYMFPIVPILLVYLWEIFPRLDRLEKAILHSCVIIMMMLSFFSFNEIALNYLSI